MWCAFQHSVAGLTVCVCLQVQGVLAAAAESWPHIHISDSLVMADAAVKMAQAGCSTIAVLGVDFMSENVRAILDEAGLTHVKVGGAATSMFWGG
jgi:quinolinate synthase